MDFSENKTNLRLRKITHGITHGKIAHEIFLWSHLLPEAFFSDETKEQLRLKNCYMPKIPTRFAILRYRDWGDGMSLALTPKFQVRLDTIFPQVHPEIQAWAAGEAEKDRFYAAMKESGFSEEAVRVRRQKTEKLMTVSPKDVFSEVQLDASGNLGIRDGHHRTGLARLHGLVEYSVRITVKVKLR